MNDSVTSHEQFINKSGVRQEQVRGKSWTSHDHGMNKFQTIIYKLWNSHKNVLKKSLTSL